LAYVPSSSYEEEEEDIGGVGGDGGEVDNDDDEEEEEEEAGLVNGDDCEEDELASSCVVSPSSSSSPPTSPHKSNVLADRTNNEELDEELDRFVVGFDLCLFFSRWLCPISFVVGFDLISTGVFFVKGKDSSTTGDDDDDDDDAVGATKSNAELKDRIRGKYGKEGREEGGGDDCNPLIVRGWMLRCPLAGTVSLFSD
jgi:hypothetical protein